jgi:hypothetical protein
MIFLQNLIPQLKDHLLARLRGIEYAGDEHNFSNSDQDLVILANNKIHEHSILQINYTTYDLRREQDCINPQTRADLMVLSHENDEEKHPYWYAQLICIFHIDVWYYGGDNAPSTSRHMDVLFVYWFGWDMTFPAGFSNKCLHCINFITNDTSNPDLILAALALSILIR